MGSEIERKFLVATVPGKSALGTGVRIRQGYLAEEDQVEVRLRLFDDHAVLSVKAGTGLSRTEVERTLDSAEADELWPYTAGQRIDKVRYRVAVDGAVAEVDRYDGDLDGLATVEVEFASVDDADAFTPPLWFGRELTGESGWSNAALARKGTPPG